MKHTIFDDVFRTMIEKMPELVIPFINEAFHSSYPKDTVLIQLRNEHLQEKEKVITDSCIQIENKRYHMECQSTDDPTMAIRMFVYDVSVAAEHAQKRGRKYRVFFPYSCVLYLRSTKKTPDCLKVEMIFQNDKLHVYTVPAVKVGDYTKEYIFEKDLFLLLPFYALRYENQVYEINENPKLFQKVIDEYREIGEKMEEKLAADGQTNFYTDISLLIIKVADYVFRKADKIKKGVEEVMRGKILELESEKLLAKGEKIGEVRGEERLSILINRLILDGKSEKIQAVVTDPKTRKELYHEYGL